MKFFEKLAITFILTIVLLCILMTLSHGNELLFLIYKIVMGVVVTSMFGVSMFQLWKNPGSGSKPLPESEWRAPPRIRATCMPPDCNDYPECDHRS